jgi:hypothetical protein
MVMRADNGACDLIVVGSEVAVQKVVGITEVTVAVVVVGAKSSSVWIGSGVMAKPKTVCTNRKSANQPILFAVKMLQVESRRRELELRYNRGRELSVT